jgi:hypothetical protein
MATDGLFNCPVHKNRVRQCLRVLEQHKEPWKPGDSTCFARGIKAYIITLRRTRRALGGRDFQRFKWLIEDNLLWVRRYFSTRWIVSIADTYADHGTLEERSNGMLVSLMNNWEKFAWSVRYMYGVPDKAKMIMPIRREGDPPHVGRRILWRGVMVFSLGPKADMHVNLVRRMRHCLRDTPVLDTLFCESLQRMLDAEGSTLGICDHWACLPMKKQMEKILGA